MIKERKDIDMFKCSFCGKEFENALDRANCEIKCDKDIKIKAEKERQDKLFSERTKRSKEVMVAYNEYIKTCDEAKKKYEKLKEKYINDYGVFGKTDYVSFDALFRDINSLF